MSRKWLDIVWEARQIALGYSTPVTLRQLHYRLVAAGVGGYVNNESCYSILSKQTAAYRRCGEFPALSDLTRGVDRPTRFADADDARAWLAQQYRRDRTENQRYQVWVLYEKATLSAQIESWTEEYGIPIAALRGYSSESLEREIFGAMRDDGREIIVFYLGDLDPEGEDIERNILDQAEKQGIEFEVWERLAVQPAQITQFGLVANPGKPSSNRAPGFIAKYGQLFQIEAEAIDPADLERLVIDAITDPVIFDSARWQNSKAREAVDRRSLI
jgi:hypothetical protein